MITKKHILFVLIAFVFGCLALYFFGSAMQQEPLDITQESSDNAPEMPEVTMGDETSGMAFEEEPEARAIYDKMIETMCKVESVSYKSDYQFKIGSRLFTRCTYTAWLKKPNYVRIEAGPTDSETAGILIGNGDCLWIHWPGGRSHLSANDQLEESSEKNRFYVYMKEATPTGKDSIRSKTSLLGTRMGVPIIDPSTFHAHGHTISKKPQIDGIKRTGEEAVMDIECDVIEVYFNKGQEIWQLWLSKEDHLPRKLKRVMIKKQGDIVINELWSDVIVNPDIPPAKFTWTPPEGWSQYCLPDSEGEL